MNNRPYFSTNQNQLPSGFNSNPIQSSILNNTRHIKRNSNINSGINPINSYIQNDMSRYQTPMQKSLSPIPNSITSNVLRNSKFNVDYDDYPSSKMNRAEKTSAKVNELKKLNRKLKMENHRLKKINVGWAKPKFGDLDLEEEN